MSRLEGKRALVTGGAAGIGRAAARLFAAEGARVAVCDVNRESGDSLVAAIRKAGGEALYIDCDVGEEESVEQSVAQVTEAFGGIDVLYNNAGGATARDGRVTDLPLAEFWRTIRVDLFGTFLFCRMVIPVMIDGGGGSIINTTSIRALIGTAGADAYTCAKGGVLTLTKALALQYGERGIRVNAVSPGAILTERVRALMGDAAGLADNPLMRKHVLGPGEPEDIARMALFLASDESRLVTGAILPVDSGASAA